MKERKKEKTPQIRYILFWCTAWTVYVIEMQ